MIKEYTQAETRSFINKRNAKRNQERRAPRCTLVWSGSKGTFIGSIRAKFTGPKRNNFGNVFSRN